MKHRTIFAALMLCLGTLNGCGAARPSKFYQLTLPNDKTPGADPAPFRSHCSSGRSPRRTCIETIILSTPLVAK